MPSPALPVIEFPRIDVPVVAASETKTPDGSFEAMTLPAPAVVPPINVSTAPCWTRMPRGVERDPLPFGSGRVPVRSVPMQLPWITLPTALPRYTNTPRPLPEIRLRSATTVPPTVLSTPEIQHPARTVGHRGRPGRVGADEVAADHVLRRARLGFSQMPSFEFPEIRLRSAGSAPPMRLPDERTSTPSDWLGTPGEPSGSTPM